ncbi:MAG: SpaA isopeptide-forming pilin-related protein [Blautia massiliensis (ex Durand et al. 2017)]
MGNVNLKKVDTKGTTLNGAEFQLLKVTPAEREGAEATKTPISVVKVTNGEYKVALDGEQRCYNYISSNKRYIKSYRS